MIHGEHKRQPSLQEALYDAQKKSQLTYAKLTALFKAIGYDQTRLTNAIALVFNVQEGASIGALSQFEVAQALVEGSFKQDVNHHLTPETERTLETMHALKGGMHIAPIFEIDPLVAWREMQRRIGDNEVELIMQPNIPPEEICLFITQALPLLAPGGVICMETEREVLPHIVSLLSQDFAPLPVKSFNFRNKESGLGLELPQCSGSLFTVHNQIPEPLLVLHKL